MNMQNFFFCQKFSEILTFLTKCNFKNFMYRKWKFPILKIHFLLLLYSHFREYVRTGAAGVRTRRSLGHHLLHPQNFDWSIFIKSKYHQNWRVQIEQNSFFEWVKSKSTLLKKPKEFIDFLLSFFFALRAKW